jgi:anti-anti-sigma factor
MPYRDGARGAVEIQHSVVEDDIVLVALHGRLDLKAAPPVQGALLEHLAEQPAGVIVDLAGVEAIDPICAAVFSAVTYPAGRWQGINLVLCRPRPPVATVLSSVAVPRFLPVCDTLDQALSSALARPAWLRETFWFGPMGDAARRARALVASACRRWELPEAVVGRAGGVAGVLVADAAGRLHTEIVLGLELRQDGLGITVQHNGPVPHPRDPEERDGERLRLVRRYALAAGTSADPEGGSTAWCVLPVDPPPSAN